MGIRQGFKKIGKSFFDYRTWMDMERLKSGFTNLRGSMRTYFVPQKQQAKPDDFHATVQKFKLSEADLRRKAYAFLRLTFLMVFVTLGVLSYTLYLYAEEHWRAAFIATSVTLVGAALTFRYHFWYFQLKQRKLGCSIKEWFLVGILRRQR